MTIAPDSVSGSAPDSASGTPLLEDGRARDAGFKDIGAKEAGPTDTVLKDGSLKVAEAVAKDTGRGIARLDPGDMRALGLETGDVIEVTGKRGALCRVLPAHAKQRGQKLIQMDGILRANARTGLDQHVTVRRVITRRARSVILAPVDAPGRSLPPRYLSRLLDGIPVQRGNCVRVTPFGPQPHTFVVQRTDPPGQVIFDTATQVRCEGTAKARSAVTYEDIGGLHKEVRRVREIIELPLKHPEVFEHLGIDPPKGVLLYGPPGTGKTLIARAVAHEASVHFIHVNGPEIIDKAYGASEAHLRQIFDEAQAKAPAFIFIDEIDAIAPNRTQINNDRQMERRVVAQLLALMDGLNSRGQVIVAAATNIPDNLDPALRRPGRFDREAEIGVPDRDGRREILEVHSRGMPLGPGVTLDHLAGLTHGFVGADLAALCREAAMSAVRRLIPDIDLDAGFLPVETLSALRVEWADFEDAIGEVSPSALREIAAEISETRWSDVGGLEDVKRALHEAAVLPLTHGPLFARMGVRPPRGILMHGGPGRGKTLLARALAGECEANFIAVQGPQLVSMWVGESERAVREVFRKAKQTRPCVIFIDEIDALAPRRGSGEDPVSERLVAEFLVALDGMDQLQDIAVIAATNRVDRLDPALIRPGRFDSVIELPLPDDVQRAAILAIHTKKMPLAGDVSLSMLAAKTTDWSGAALAALCRNAAMAAIRRRLEPDAAGPALVTVADFDAALTATHREAMA
ncbi:CDC48 family AAA ATPase [Eilatimonas milleporae]|uniref:Transitional endoplasmic reticulum ATPase n=1 Tax=Eilatimonas milleporae TaxID=911205 RepID=A0A3M0CXR4_9PROT|nr:CDC48 family AAA ATPase [Eilatimonas milleporae]RMB12376.1 transitional endoplasmic reticulum ATPase [Eilatimonas milleporae]